MYRALLRCCGGAKHANGGSGTCCLRRWTFSTKAGHEPSPSRACFNRQAVLCLMSYSQAVVGWTSAEEIDPAMQIRRRR